jgi:hypothetical protein
VGAARRMETAKEINVLGELMGQSNGPRCRRRSCWIWRLLSSSAVGSHASEGFVVHHIEIDKMPNLVGRERKRWFAFEGPGRLRLRIDRSQLSQPVVDDELIWERVPH